MAQETFVGRPDPKKARDLVKALESSGLTPRDIQYSIFSYAGNGLTVTLYNSGKLVVQGINAENFGRQLLGEVIDDTPVPEVAVIGTDESGKGDYFGPLVVAAVFIPAEERARTRAGEIDDSKKLSDTTIKRLSGAIQKKFPYAVVALDPPEYNKRYPEVQNLNKMLADLHAKAILEVSKKIDCRKVLTDQFGDESLVRLSLGKRAAEFELDQRPRAEEDPAVAAASILARDEFVRRLATLSDDIAVDLPMGAGEEVEIAAKKFMSIHGKQGLSKVAKLHFKTTQKINGLF